MQTSVAASGAAPAPQRIKRTVSAPGIGHHHQRRSWRPPESVQARQMRKALPVVLENEMDDFNVMQVPESPPQATPASVERTRKAMQATLALLKKSSSTPTLNIPDAPTNKEHPSPHVRPNRSIDAKEGAAMIARGGGLQTPKTPSKTLRRRSHKATITANANAAAAATANAAAQANTPTTPMTPSRLKTPLIPSSAPSSAASSIARPNQPTNISIPKRTLSGTSTRMAAPSPRLSSLSNPATTPSTYASQRSSPDPEPLRSSRNISANDMVHAYYTILRERDPAHYLLNLNEEEEEIISQSQYAALLKLACQKFKRGDGRDRVALSYAEAMIGGGGSSDGESGW